MAKIKLPNDQRTPLLDKLQRYIAEELDYELGQFEAEFMLDFIVDNLGPHFYNQGLRDAQAVVADRLELVTEAIDELEQ
ncbi:MULTISPECIES: DUF2164 domain-containing protein [Corallincola]|uniref:DUF2164 domain-containing protein n=2 Tax=Corallincola TaxID=1775176 RepID=A0ABY1WQU8_9GAMM|nr:MULTISPECIES: DUF2164 domain-containing protein [Corallincola]TAA47076.1 DUF2164 domain-containing protein [Corallincola spongiicola]TCI04727.1 DUF2164 domain-containing protein [Corallincola luteus]